MDSQQKKSSVAPATNLVRSKNDQNGVQNHQGDEQNDSYEGQGSDIQATGFTKSSSAKSQQTHAFTKGKKLDGPAPR